MTLAHFYLVASTILITWVSMIWSSRTTLNTVCKLITAGIAFCGAVLVAKEFFL